MFIKNLKEFNLPKLEKKVLEYWKKNGTFERTLENHKTLDVGRKKGEPYFAKATKGKRNFVFFEGPPTANARPGLHHVLARAFKDAVLRYKTMQGYYAPRRAGWDTHGLPVEIQVEKELGLKSKKDIEKYGIAEFNKKCRESVWKHKDEWERLTERMGFWLDMKNPYVTYEKDYIETLWWIIAQFWKKKLLYKGNKIVNWCPRCGTGLSSHELAQGYKTVTDEAVTVKFQILDSKSQINFKLKISTNKPVYILSWTTTPWTLPGNVALAVGEKITYVFIESGNEILILAKDRILEVGVFGKIIKEVEGKELVDLDYEPLFEVAPLKNEKAYKVYAADFVTTTDGTGVVHTAVMYGEDDYKLGVKVGLPQHHTVDATGKFTKDVKGLAGLYVKAKETEEKIINYLKTKNYHLKTEPYKHEYPHCWRCSTPLLYYARSAWFVTMAKLKKQLTTNNETINWIPEYIKKGRFGEWLREVKDWNFSRERYWGTPLPIWECKKCGATDVAGSLEELDKKTSGARNEYLLMRHGESEAMLVGVIDSGKGKYHLTSKGKKRVKKAARDLSKTGVDLIFSSDVLRAKETANIIAKNLGVKKVVFDKRLREINLGVVDGRPVSEYAKVLPILESRFEAGPEEGESLRMLRTRLWNFLKETDRRYKHKKILIVAHEYPIWMLNQIMMAWTQDEAISEMKSKGKIFVKAGQIIILDLKTAPRDESGEVDLHRPYVDEIFLRCSRCKGEMKRVKELCDVWFDSGAMPFAQGHWPFAQRANGKWQRAGNYDLQFVIGDLPYPADYICEAVDQTRGWFYTLLAVATALGKGAPYKNVISLGHINDKYGQKMSKSKGNIVDPWVMAEKYGMDAVRWYFYAATPPGEPKNFDEQEILKTYRRFHLILWNSLMFYRTYAGSKSPMANRKSENILDKWILARLDETVQKATKHFDRYEVREAALAVESLVDDLSRWYIRRSRRRLSAVAKGYGGQAETGKDFEVCSATLERVIASILKMMAPFNPFFTEVLWNVLGGKDSIHLEEWPKSQSVKREAQIIKQMEEVRRLATLGLAKRAEAGIKVRQPLAKLSVKRKAKSVKLNKELLEILAEEVNVKKVVYDTKLKEEIELDTKITAELREEGILRELVRAVQDLRQKANLRSNEMIVVMLEFPEELKFVVSKNEGWLKKEVGAKNINYGKSDKFSAEADTKIDDRIIWIGIKKL